MFIRSFRRIGLLTLAAMLLLGSVASSAEDRCDRKIRNAEAKLQQAVQRHGEHSRQAEKQRRHVEDVRRSCHR